MTRWKEQRLRREVAEEFAELGGLRWPLYGSSRRRWVPMSSGRKDRLGNLIENLVCHEEKHLFWLRRPRGGRSTVAKESPKR